ncbi:MAG TPA: acyl carrier protein [Nitrospirae bacterium]|nr:acyl carrier protein [Nitrospirota bacterium]
MSDSFENEMRDLVSDITEVPADKLIPEADFIDDLDVDSLKAIEIVAAVEKKYRVVIPEEDIPKLRNLAEITSYVNKLRQN